MNSRTNSSWLRVSGSCPSSSWRYANEDGSTIITYNLTFGARDQAFAGDRVLTADMLDRLLSHGQVIQIQGESYCLKVKRKDGIIRDPPGK